MSEHAPTTSQHDAGHVDPMSHVPPPSPWPAVVAVGLTIIPFGVLGILNVLKSWGALFGPGMGLILTLFGTAIFLTGIMGWCSQVIREKAIVHDPAQQQKDLQFFILLFMVGELTAFSAIFGYFFYRNTVDPAFGPLPGMHFGGPLVAYATFILLSSSLTCEIAHHALLRRRYQLAKLFFALTVLLGLIFLGFTGYEWGELIQRGFYSTAIGDHSAAAFAATFFTGTGFHAVHVGIGVVMLFMVLYRLEFGHFRGDRHFSAVAASWYWHFVDIVWVLLFITIYVVA